MKKDSRLTWKRSLDGHEDVGLREGVTVGDAICKLADLEERDAVEVVHADWKDCENADFVYCTHCKTEWNVFDNRAELFYYCPHCGAKMDGDGNA